MDSLSSVLLELSNDDDDDDDDDDEVDNFSACRCCCMHSVPTTIAAKRDATLDIAITNDKDDVVRKIPPRSGPTRNANVEAASLHAKCLDSK